MDEFDLDRTTEVGWASFLSRLADHLGTLAEPLVVTPVGGDDGGAPVLEVTARGTAEDPRLHGELRAPAGATWPDDERARHMLALGWSLDADRTTYVIDLPRSHAHLLAAAVTDTLREVVGAPHPAFLDAGALTIDAPVEAALLPADQVGRPLPRGQLALDDLFERRPAVVDELHRRRLVRRRPHSIPSSAAGTRSAGSPSLTADGSTGTRTPQKQTTQGLP